ncbi:hypothetical protein Aperf_G00000086976 [Anoplocephala perfoliata]
MKVIIGLIFRYFLLDPSGCLVPYLDGEEGIRASPPAGVWCTGAIENEQKLATSPTNLPIWFSVFRYAFAPRGRRAFSTSPVLAIHNSPSNSVSFYSIRGEGGTSSKSLRSLSLDFTDVNSSSPWYGYADRLYFHYFSGTEDLKSRPSRASSQHVVIHLASLSPIRLPDQESLADYSKMLEAISRLASDLGCRILKGPTPSIAVATSSQDKGNIISARAKQNNKTNKRSVKFHLPLTKDVLPSLSTIPTGFEVPEASMLLEESMPQVPPIAYSPYRYFPSPPPPQSPCCHHLRSHHHQRHAQHQHSQANNSNNGGIALLDALIERLLSAQIHQQSPVKDEKVGKKEVATVGTSTPVGLDVCSVAVNTSAIWPTPADIGLVSPSEVSSSPKKLLESVGIQCDSVPLSPTASPVARSFPLEFDRIGAFPLTPIPTAPQPLQFQQSSESVLSLDTSFTNKSPPPAQPMKDNGNENAIGDMGYSRLLAGIQQVLQAAPHLRKTASVPGELSLLAQQPPRCTSAADNVRGRGPNTELPTEDIDADVEADVIRHQRHCEKEVAEKLDLTNSFLPSQLTKQGPPEKSTPRPGHSEVSFPATMEINSFTFATDFDLPSNRQYSRLNRGSKSTDESAVLMGLARKYLPPSVIAQLAPSNSVTQDVSDFSLSTRRYLKDHGLISSHGDGSTFGSAPLDEDRWIGGNVCSSNETSTIPRLTVMDEEVENLTNANPDSFLFSSGGTVRKHNELHEVENRAESRFSLKGTPPENVGTSHSYVIHWGDLTSRFKSKLPHPVILIPGDGLLANTSSKLLYNNATRRTEENDKAIITFPGWGETWSVDNLDSQPHTITKYFQDVTSAFTRNPYYIQNSTIRGAPFDFRRAPNENEDFVPKIKDLVEETFKNGQNQPVVLLAHSMGALYTLKFLNNQTNSWKRKYIKAFIAASAPLGGSMKALKIEASGDNFGVYFGNPLYYREVQRSMPSLAFLLPDPRLWSPDEIVIVTQTKNYTVHDYKEFFSDIGFPEGYQMYEDTKADMDSLVPPTGVDEIHCIYSSSLQTPAGMVYPSTFPDADPTLIYESDGDGTVNSRSLSVCKSWPGVNTQIIPEVNHLSIMVDPTFIKAVMDIAKADRLPPPKGSFWSGLLGVLDWWE